MSAARDRLKAGYYNSLEKTATNPGGMADFGHRLNFPLALKDVGDVAQEVVDSNDATLAAVVADNNATEATIVADNNATEAAIIADNDATEAAIAANNSATALAVAASAASATNSKNAAAQSATNAAASETAAGASSATAVRVVTANFPDRLDAAANFFTEALTGDPGTVASAPVGKVVNVAGFGYVYQAAGAATLAHKGVMTAGAEYVIEVAVEIEQTIVGGSETPAARICLQGLDKDYASTGTAVTGPLVATPIGVTTITRRFAYVAPAGGTAWPQPGAAVWLRPAVDINRKSDDSGAAAGSTARVRRLSVRDVTAVVAAELAAAAAAASANSVATASQADAEAGSGTGLMSATRVGQAINKLAVPLGGCIRAPVSPGSQFLAATGASYLKASYPALAALLGDKYASFTVGAAPTGGAAAYRGAYAETGLGIAAGGSSISTCDGNGSWTLRTNTLPFDAAQGALKTATKYFVYGFKVSNFGQRGLYSSANGTTGWADVTTYPGLSSGVMGIASMAYGLVGGTAYLVAAAGSTPFNVRLIYSANEGATWTEYGSDLTSSAPANELNTKVVIANGVLGVWVKTPATFLRSVNLTSYAAVTPIPAVFSSGNNLFICISTNGDITTSTDLLTFTARLTPRGYEGVNDYLGYINGEHFFAATVFSQARIYATADFNNWRTISMPASVVALAGPLCAVSTSKLLRAGGLFTSAHNPATEFPTPNLSDEFPTWIKAI